MLAKTFRKIKRSLHPATLRRSLLRITLKGSNVVCPCCGGHFITFLPAGLQKRAKAACPNCGSLERHRSLWLYFENNPALFAGTTRLLHVAPEKIFSRYFQAHPAIVYTAIDLSPEAYDYDVKTIAMDLTHMVFADNYFDAIVCSHVLEHIPDDRSAMQQMYRVLKPGAWAIINVPARQDMPATLEDITINDPVKQLALFGQPDHVRIYGMDYTDRLQAAGFEVDCINLPLQYDHNTRFRFGLKENEIIYLCRKPQ